MRHYCTYFDRYYLPRALALYQSLCQHAGDFVLHALCLDASTERVIASLNLAHLRPLALEDFLRQDSALRAARCDRDSLGFYFTCTPTLPIYLFACYPEIAELSYLDADLYFFASPEPLYAEVADAELVVIEHRFPPQRDRSREHGRFNVGLLHFRRGPQAERCLAHWRAQCLEWCHDRAEEGRFGDQKYLDAWPEHYPGLRILQHPGANLAPWNLARHQLARAAAGIRVDGQPLVFFHFHRTRRLWARLYDPTLAEFEVPGTPVIRAIFQPYARALERAEAEVRALLPDVDLKTSQRELTAGVPRLRERLSSLYRHTRKLCHGDYLWL